MLYVISMVYTLINHRPLSAQGFAQIAKFGSLRKKGYTQGKTDLLLKAIVLPKIVYGLSFYAASVSDLAASQSFYKVLQLESLYISELCLFYKVKHCYHPLHNLHARYKDSSERLRNITGMRLKC